ncbi:MAG: DUF294 nucleotidyltransferase-like domain-containing protein [Sulfuritalea sp.]|nr:DUF294 nucleotidyltransferase-like domain-containing protein [Sulfuritalea sp.]
MTENPDQATLDALCRRAPFDRLTPEQTAWLSGHLRARDYPHGAALLTPGAEAHSLFFIVRGVVQLEAMGKRSEEDRILAELVEGESFPLEALQEERPVFSTFRARTDVRCLELPISDYRQLCQMSEPFDEFCRQRAAAFLEQSRRIYHAHFASEATATHLASPLRGLIRGTPACCPLTASLGEILPRMEREGLKLLAVTDDAGRPLGTFSLDDLLAACNAGRMDPALTVGDLMSADCLALPAEALGFEAALLMAERGLDHVLVIDGGRVAAVVAERALFALQSVGIAQLAIEIRKTADTAELQECALDIHQLAHNLLGQGVAANQLTRIVSILNDRLTARVIELELPRHAIGDIDFCWIALGSEGRLEQTLCTDQDNGIIFAVPAGGDTEALRQRLLPFARAVNTTLSECGFPLCRGEVMAGNPQWCLSLKEWQGKFTKWLHLPEPEALLNASIFFDLRALWGATHLADELLAWLAQAAGEQSRFLHLMTENALQRQPPIGFFRDFVVDKEGEHPNTIDLKLSGISLFVDAARVLGLAHGVTDSNTERRLRLAAEKAGMKKPEVDAWVDAFHFMQSLRLRHQHGLTARGEPAHNRIDPYAFNQLDRKFFLEALRQAGLLQKCVAMSFGQRA